MTLSDKPPQPVNLHSVPGQTYPGIVCKNPECRFAARIVDPIETVPEAFRAVVTGSVASNRTFSSCL